MKISNIEKRDFEDRFPYLKIEWDSSIKGNIFFDSYYNKDTDEFYYDSSSVVCSDKKYHIKYRYEISITLPKNDNEFIVVKEVWWKLEKVVKAKNKKKEDLHIEKNGSLCLCWPEAKQKYINNWFSINEVMSELIIPFFYAQRFFELYEYRPRWELPHWDEWKRVEIADLYKKAVDEISIMLWISWKSIREEKYVYDIIENRQKPKWHHNCICWSKLKFRSCHNGWLQKRWNAI